MNTIEKTLWFIESHFAGDITLEAIAKAGYDPRCEYHSKASREVAVLGEPQANKRNQLGHSLLLLPFSV
jgi:hypothetical protein